MSTTAEQTTSIPTGTWSVDPVHSQVGFAVDYLVGTFRGSFTPVEGTLAVAEDGTTELKGSAQASSIKVQDETLGTHLLAPISSTQSALRRSASLPTTSAAPVTTSPCTAS